MTNSPRVALFATCFNDTMWPEAPRATVTLLERLGCTVEFPRAQTCCGQMFTNTGYADEATPLVRAFVDVFDDYEYVVAPSGSCVGSVREQHPWLARRAGDPGLESAAEETDAFGDFEFEDLPDNQVYKLTISAPGYKTQELDVRTYKSLYLGDILLQK